MCDYGVVSGPTIASAIYGSAATATEVAATTAALQAATTAAVLAAGAGTALYAGNREQQQNANVAAQVNAQNDALNQQERQRQQDFNKQKQDAFNGAVDASSQSAHDANQDADAATLTSKYSTAADAAQNSIIPGLSSNPDSQTGPRVVQDSYKGDLKGVGDYLRQQAGARAKIDAFGQANQTQSEALQNSGNLLSLLNNFSQGSKSILPIEQGVNNQGAQYQFQSNQNEADNTAGLGNLISNLGVAGNSLASTKNAAIATAGTQASLAAAAKKRNAAALGSSSYLPPG